MQKCTKDDVGKTRRLMLFLKRVTKAELRPKMTYDLKGTLCACVTAMRSLVIFIVSVYLGSSRREVRL